MRFPGAILSRTIDHPGSPMNSTENSRQTTPATVERGLGFVLLALSLVGLLINFLQ
jgi:hypothetical protein